MISCKKYYDIRMTEIKETVSKMERVPTLLIIQVGDNEASNRYVRNKVKDCESVGIKAGVKKFNESITEDELIKYMINNLGYNKNHTTHYNGVIVQLPLPKHIDERLIKNLIPSYMDVDGFVNPGVTPCTPRGIMDWLKFNGVDLDGKNVTIIGRSDLVGKPLAELMLKENATVTVCHSHTVNLSENLQNADIIVSAVGKRNLLDDYVIFLGRTDEHIFPIVIDVGINFDENGKICGDCDKSLYQNYYLGYITPVPKGVGLLTRVALLDNLLDLANLS